MVTDRTRIARADPGHTDLCEVPWPSYKIFADDNTNALVKQQCENGEIGCVDCKTRLGGFINDFLRPIREKREHLARNPEEVQKIIDYGNNKARKYARETLNGVRELMGLKRWNG